MHRVWADKGPTATPAEANVTESNSGTAGSVFPSRSQRALKADPGCLASEVELIWLDPAARQLPWLRERFTSNRRIPGLLALTVNSRGRIVRAFYARPECQAVYARGFAAGWCTCPLEGIDPQTIAPGQPAEPAHPKLRQLQQQQQEAGR